MNTTARILTAATLAVLTGSALAAQPARESGRERPADDRTVLRGPDAGLPDRGGRAERAAEQARAAANPGFQMIAMALRGLERSDDETLRLTDTQKEQIRAITAEHREAMRKFMEEHKDEIAKLRAAAGEDRPARFADRPGAAPRDGGDGAEEGEDARLQRVRDRRPADGADRPRRPIDAPPPRDGMDDEMDDAPADRMPPEQRLEARAKLRAFMADAPHEQEAKRKLMDVLTQPQKDRVTEIMKAQAERLRDRARGDAPANRPGRDARPTEVKPDGAPAERVRPAEGDRPARRPRPGSDG